MFGSNMFKGGGGGFNGSYLPDTDPASDIILGRFKIETGLSDWFAIGHVDGVNYTAAAVLQDASFNSYLNCPAGKQLGFTVGGAGRWIMLDVATAPFYPGADLTYDFGRAAAAAEYSNNNRINRVFCGSVDCSGKTFSASSGQQDIMSLAATINQSGTASYTGVFIDITETAVGSGTNLPLAIDVDATNVFSVDKSGGVSVAAGTSAAPSLRSTADTDTGFYWNVSKVGCTVDGATGGSVWEVDYSGGRRIGFFGTTPAPQTAAYTMNATKVEDRTLLASASATTTNNNNVLAALITDLQAYGLLG